jgi:3-methyladenine DNA glycosylase AlkD
MDIEEAMAALRDLANEEDREGMARFGIPTGEALGIRLWDLRRLAKEIKRDHALALDLWDTEVHEARLLATMVADPKEVTEDLMEQWVADFYSWDICDQACSNLFDQTPWAHEKAVEWAGREGEFQKRAGFTMMAVLAVHDKKADDDTFVALLPIIEREAGDDRNFVKKAVNWALRQIGKRNGALNALAIEAAERIREQGSRPARWIASDALRELRSDKVQRRLIEKASRK